MAFSFNGIGTTFYGQRDFRLDGSYVTTAWFIIAYVPLIPLSSLRVIPGGPAKDSVPFIISGTEYAVVERGAMNWRQVFSTYGYMALVIGWAYLVGKVAFWIMPRAMNTLSNLYLVVLACALPIPTPWVLRHFAIRKVEG